MTLVARKAPSLMKPGQMESDYRKRSPRYWRIIIVEAVKHCNPPHHLISHVWGRSLIEQYVLFSKLAYVNRQVIASRAFSHPKRHQPNLCPNDNHKEDKINYMPVASS